MQVRLHDLKHTFGRRLRAAGVSLETRKVLLGHRNGDITTHYSAPELRWLGCVQELNREGGISLQGLSTLLRFVPCWAVRRPSGLLMDLK